MRQNTKLLARTALLSALTAVGAFIKIPLGVSSVTLQFFFTAMAGVLLGPVSLILIKKIGQYKTFGINR